jgi:hypothetical protein
MNQILKTAIIAASISSVGCASIVSDSSYPVTINSSPDDAKFTITNVDSGATVMKGQTPSTLTLEASNGFFDGATYSVQFDKAGYDSQSLTLDSSVDGWYVANILFGGILGFLIIDPATGAMWKLDESLLVSLNRQEDESTDKNVTLMTIDEVPDHLRDDLVRIN